MIDSNITSTWSVLRCCSGSALETRRLDRKIALGACASPRRQQVKFLPEVLPPAKFASSVILALAARFAHSRRKFLNGNEIDEKVLKIAIRSHHEDAPSS